jgi:hypothetical protein
VFQAAVRFKKLPAQNWVRFPVDQGAASKVMAVKRVATWQARVVARRLVNLGHRSAGHIEPCVSGVAPSAWRNQAQWARSFGELYLDMRIPVLYQHRRCHPHAFGLQVRQQCSVEIDVEAAVKVRPSAPILVFFHHNRSEAFGAGLPTEPSWR